MENLTSTLRSQGASIITTLPAEVVRRLAVSAGQELAWLEDGLGGFRIVPQSSEVTAALEAHTRVMAEYDSVFRALAK